MLAERAGRVVDTIGGLRLRLGGLSWKVLGVRALRALRERWREEVGIVSGIWGGSWARILVGEDLGGGVGGRCIRSGFGRGRTKGEPLVESVLLSDGVEVPGLWCLVTVPVLLVLSLLSFLSVMTGRVPVLFGGSAMVFSNECESDANDASSNSLLSGESGLCWGVNERMDEVTVLGEGEMTPKSTR